jgi:hypothetical protein
MDTDKADAMRVMMMVLLLLGCSACRAEVSCFKTAAQAAAGVGEQEGGGYRLEFVRTDAYSGRSWARVRSCVHPEWPAVVIGVGTLSGVVAFLNRDPASTEKGPPVLLPVVRAGATVRVVELDERVRIEMVGVAQGAGRVGDRVRVRILGPGGVGEGRLSDAVVRSADLLEVEL